jgi:hypothetical protein
LWSLSSFLVSVNRFYARYSVLAVANSPFLVSYTVLAFVAANFAASNAVSVGCTRLSLHSAEASITAFLLTASAPAAASTSLI